MKSAGGPYPVFAPLSFLTLPSGEPRRRDRPRDSDQIADRMDAEGLAGIEPGVLEQGIEHP